MPWFPVARDKAAHSWLDLAWRDLAFEIRRYGSPLQSGDRCCRVDRLRAEFLAGLVRVAGMTAASFRHRLQSRRVTGVAGVVHQRPCPRERRRTEIIVIPAHGIAGSVTNSAIDAFDCRVGSAPFGRRRQDFLDILVSCL